MNLCVVLVLATAVAVCVTGYQCPTNGLLKPDGRKAIVDKHNTLRSELVHGKTKGVDGYFARGSNMFKLAYDCDLEEQAARWAKKCDFNHSPKSSRPGCGENIWAQWGGAQNPDNVTSMSVGACQAWWDETRFYKTVHDLNFTMEKVGWDIGHFTQMAWYSSYRIGCAFEFCPKKMDILVCHYKTPGNKVNRDFYELGEPCKNDYDCNIFAESTCSYSDGLCNHP